MDGKLKLWLFLNINIISQNYILIKADLKIGYTPNLEETGTLTMSY